MYVIYNLYTYHEATFEHSKIICEFQTKPEPAANNPVRQSPNVVVVVIVPTATKNIKLRTEY